MIVGLYTIKDELSEFTPPVTITDDEVAKRYFRNIVRENKIMKDNPWDYSIWKIGIYNSEIGEVKAEKPKKIENATSFIKIERKEETSNE